MMDLSAYRDIFIEEMNDQLERMDQTLLALERSPSPDLVQTLFRIAHTVKGSSSTMAFKELSDLTHQVEFALEWIREKKTALTAGLIDLLFRAMDAMKKLRDEYVAGGSYSDSAALAAEIQAMLGQNAQAAAGASSPARSLPLLGPGERLRAEEGAAAGMRLLAVRVTLKGDCLMKAARYQIMLRRIEDDGGSIIASSLPLGELAVGDEDGLFGAFTLIAAVPEEGSALQSKLLGLTDTESAEVEPYRLEVPVSAQPSAEPARQSAATAGAAAAEGGSRQEPLNAAGGAGGVGGATAGAGGAAAGGAAAGGAGAAAAAGAKSAPTVRVSVDRLDHLMNLVGELLIDQTSLASLKSAGMRKDPAKSLQAIDGVSDHMGRVIKELQEGVMKTRMLPIDQLFSRFPRLVRDLSQKLGKDLDLVIQGGETELDRTIIEELGDPLIHLIRNSADHGIESPAERAALGKPAKGLISLTSFHEENHVVIVLKDDGKGIDAARITESALRKGLITEEKAARLTPSEAVNLIFEPGFSTAAQVSEVSGRGVGMDIVRSQIGRLNGIIEIDTEPGKGTSFTIRLPLTLAIIKGLLVKVAGRSMVIPMYSVAEIVRIPPEDIQTIQGEKAIINHGRIVPLYWLHDKLQYPRGGRTGKSVPTVIIKSVEKSAAFAVDEIIGNQEVVIKSLGSYLGKMNHLSGATILGNGQVALILEASYLVS